MALPAARQLVDGVENDPLKAPLANPALLIKLPLMKKLFIAAVFTALSFAAHAADMTYSTTVEDLPLMPLLKENVDESIVFDIPQGRIVQVFAFTTESKEAIVAFYQKTLPPLGWVSDGELAYHRDQEKLLIKVIPLLKKTLVQFSFSPLKGK